MSYAESVRISADDSASVDSFSRLRVSSPIPVFDAQLTYNLQPLLFEQVASGSGASITHDSTNRAALFTFSSTPTGGETVIETYEHFRYQPGRSQEIIITFNFVATAANCKKFVGYSDGTNNGIQFELNGSTPQWTILSDTTLGDETVTQSNWNTDKLNGTGKSGITLDVTKPQIAIIDFQALYLGRVRVGFDIGGTIVYCHEFLHANSSAHPYLQTANLPIIAGMTCTGTVSTTMYYYCCTVMSEGGVDDLPGFNFAAEGTATAGNGTRTHILSIRPSTTFNSITNRSKFILDSVEILVTGNNPVYWELCLGQAISGTTTFNDVNATYSANQYNTLGTASGNPTIVIAAGYCAATNQTRFVGGRVVNMRYPITLNRSGAIRSLGTLTLLVTGVGGSSACRATIGWREVR